jgi:hypothetical protein
MNPWLILGFVLAVAAAGGAGLYQGHELGVAEVQQKWDKERAAQLAEHAAAQAAAREKEQELQASADLLRKDKDREIRDLNARTAALTNSLRDRPSRPTTETSTVSSTASAGCAPSSCTGAGLSREDARADELRASLKQCHAQYQAIRQ